MSITTRASNFIKKQTEKIFNQEEIKRDNDLMVEVDFIEDDCIKEDKKSTTALTRLNDVTAKDLLEKKLKEFKSTKRDRIFNTRLDTIERRLYGIENDIEDDEKNIVKNEDRIEILSHRTEACESRIRVVEDRVQKLENDLKKNTEINEEMEKLLKEESYSSLYLNVKTTFRLKLQKRNDISSLKCILALSSFIIALMFIWLNTELSLLVASLLIIFTFFLGLSSLIHNASKWFNFIKIRHSSKSYDIAILEYLKDDIDLYLSLQEKKNEIDKCNEIIDFNEFIKMEQKSIKKNLINGIVTVFVILVFFVFLYRFININTSYTFFRIMRIPFTIISKVLIF